MCFIPTTAIYYYDESNRVDDTWSRRAIELYLTVAALDDAPTTDVAILNGRIRLNRIFNNNIIITHDLGV